MADYLWQSSFCVNSGMLVKSGIVWKINFFSLVIEFANVGGNNLYVIFVDDSWFLMVANVKQCSQSRINYSQPNKPTDYPSLIYYPSV